MLRAKIGCKVGRVRKCTALCIENRLCVELNGRLTDLMKLVKRLKCVIATRVMCGQQLLFLVPVGYGTMLIIRWKA